MLKPNVLSARILSLYLIKRIKMRITDLYALKNDEDEKNMIKESLIEDIKNLAEARFGDKEFRKFKIEIKLRLIEIYE